MPIEVEEHDARGLADYARVSIAFEVREIAEVVEDPAGSRRFTLSARSVEAPYVKDYDVHGGPETWASRFDLSHWRFFAARDGGRRVGGAAVVFRAPDVTMLGGRSDVALLWDIRVGLHARGRGVGSSLVQRVEVWSASQGAAALEVETQNINVPACRFYAKHGFSLREVNVDAYPTVPGEIQLLWSKQLKDRGRSKGSE